MTSSPSRRLLRAGAGAVVVLLVAVAAGCARQVVDADDSTVVRPVVVDGDPGALRWGACVTEVDGLECGSLAVPVDHDRPEGETVTLTLARRAARAPQERIGTLLVNPGGPGVPGTVLALLADQLFSATLLDHFDIVGWDPRGTGSSAPIDCVEDLDPYMSPDPTPDDAAEQAALVAAARRFADACQEAAGDWLAHISTVDTVRDMDLIRAALGEEQISYFGFSYGSELGATYATLFPAGVRAMVLDGALDPSNSGEDVSRQQALGNELALDRFLAWCDEEDDCTFRGRRPAGVAFDAVMAQLDAHPVAARRAGADRPLVGQGVAYTAIVQALYDDAQWQELADAFGAAAAGDGSGLLALYDAYLQRRDDGSFTNVLESFAAISCLDHGSPRDLTVYDQRASDFSAAAPRMGALFAYGYSCAVWPVEPVEPLVVTGAGAGPILVVAATGDPATPYEASRQLVDRLEDGHLLTRDGEGHTSYGADDSCIQRAVDAYLVELVVPAAGTVCR